jgi:Putative zinc-finger
VVTAPEEYDGFRRALGAYVVGALSPSERAAVEAHLARCADCRAELAGLAGLPGRLGGIPAADVAKLVAAGAGPGVLEEPVPEMPLRPLLDRAARLRRRLRWRWVTVVAAAVLIAVSGAAAVSHVLSAPAASPVAVMHWAETLHGYNLASGAAATVQYLPRPWGLEVEVQVRHIPAGTRCALEVVTAGGRLLTAGGWTVVAGQAGAVPSLCAPPGVSCPRLRRHLGRDHAGPAAGPMTREFPAAVGWPPSRQ